MGYLWTSWLKISSVAETLAAQNFIHSTLVQFPGWSVTTREAAESRGWMSIVALVVLLSFIDLHRWSPISAHVAEP
jgi:hypothetical protein